MPLVPPDPPLSADGIVLRLVDDSDVGWITQACADPEITRYIPFIPDPYTEADARAFVRYAQEGWASGSHAPFVIAEAGDHAADGTGDRAGIGAIELHLDARDKAVGETGYWLCPAARGKGAATTALRLIAAWAFAELGIQRLQLVTAPENVPSQRVAERAGFIREGLLRAWLPTAAGRRDSFMFSLLPGEAGGR